MNKDRKIAFLLALFLFYSFKYALPQTSLVASCIYLSPIPGTTNHNPETVIVLRYNVEIDSGSIHNELFEVAGSISGVHPGKVHTSSDKLTIIFTPDQVFQYSEKVTLHLKEGIYTVTGNLVPAIDFWFTIRQQYLTDNVAVLFDNRESAEILKSIMNKGSGKGIPLSFSDFNFPIITISNNPSEGNIISTVVKSLSNYLYVFNNKAKPVFAKSMPNPVSNLKPQSSGILTYYDSGIKGFISMDSLLCPVDTFIMKNGYKTDAHEILILKNKHVLLFSYDPMIVDMSKIVTGGNPSATVSGLVIQELDENRNLFFQWRSWDHFNITDSYADLQASVIDYVHGNSLDADTDTTLIISSRNMNEITKIDRLTGQILWRLGGKKNEFIFENDTRHFAGQHSVVKQNKSTITLYDNGVGLEPQYSRGVEYEIDETIKKVKLVREYRHIPDVYANVSGNLQRLNNGNTMVYWGPSIDIPYHYISEFDKNGSAVFEARFDKKSSPTYSAYRSLWEPKSFTLSTDTLNFEGVVRDAEVYLSIKLYNNTGSSITITSAHHNNLGFYAIDLPVTIEANSNAFITLAFPSYVPGKKSDNIIFCQETDSMIVTRSLFVSVDNIAGTGIENQEQNNFKILNNPGNGEFYAEISETGQFSLHVYDLYGKLVWDSYGIGNRRYYIDLTQKTKGLYLLFIEKKGTIEKHTIKLIKQE